MDINALQTQTQAVSQGVDDSQLMELLTRKNTNLASPGTVVANSLYYDSASTVVSLAEVVQAHARYIQSLTSLVFGGTASITIPNSSFLEALVLYAEIPALPANTYLPRGWLLNSIQSISWIAGSSNVSQVFVNGQSHAQMVFSACETAEKRDKVMRLAGDFVAGPQAPGTVNRAQCQLQLPWSRMLAQTKKLPLDSNLLSSPIIIQITFAPQNSIFSGSGILAAPLAFSRATAMQVQLDLMDKQLSLRNAMMRDPTLISSYPFIFNQSFVLDIQGNTANPVTSILQGIVNADLVGIAFTVVRTDRLSGGDGSQALSPFAWEQVLDTTLTYNGLVLYQTFGRLCELFDCQDYQGSPVSPYSIVNAGGAGPYTQTPMDAYVHYISFTRIRNSVFEGYFQNSFRIANNTLNLSFRTPENAAYKLFVTYQYNAVLAISQGQSALIIS